MLGLCSRVNAHSKIIDLILGICALPDSRHAAWHNLGSRSELGGRLCSTGPQTPGLGNYAVVTNKPTLHPELLRYLSSMLYRNAILIGSAILSVAGARQASSAARGPCNDSLTRGIPARAPDALSGRAFAEQLRGLSDDERESSIRRELNAGNVPAFLRRLVPVRLHLTIWPWAQTRTFC